MERAIKDLCQLEKAALTEEVATGIHHVLEVVDRLDPAAQLLSEAGRHHAGKILTNLAAEEAAKALILIDALRCPADKCAEKSRTLGYFYDHLAKGIYVEVCNWKPINFAEVIRGVELERAQSHLDGPNGVDWIFPNGIIQAREDDLYVGFVRDDSDDAGQGTRRWTIPDNDDLFGYSTPAIIKLVRALRDVGATVPSGLSVISDIWSVIDVEPDMRIDELEELNQHTLQVLKKRGVLTKVQGEQYGTVRYHWPFPLWPRDLRVKRVDKEELREARRRWAPDAW